MTIASSGFSLGMRRELATNQTGNLSAKRQCVIVDKSSTKSNSELDLQTNELNQTMSVSSVTDQTPIPKSTPSSSIIQCSDNWKQMQKNLKMEEKQNQKRILTFEKDHLFKDLKFIPSPEMMIFSNHENSLNFIVCEALNIQINDQQSYWAKYASCVEKSLKAARNDAVSAVKKSFLKGK